MSAVSLVDRLFAAGSSRRTLSVSLAVSCDELGTRQEVNEVMAQTESEGLLQSWEHPMGCVSVSRP